MTVAITLLTCDRIAYTGRTLETLSEHNDLSRFMLLHGDDASTERDVFPLVQYHGFQTVVQTKTRTGAQSVRSMLVRAAADRGADWVLMLENDWVSVRSFPWDVLSWVAPQPDIYCLRLLGEFKEEGGTRPFFTWHAGRPGRQTVTWKKASEAPEPVEVGDIHYGSPPNVSRVAEMLWLHDGPKSDREAALKSGGIDKLTARVTNNVFYHIGAHRTVRCRR